RALGPARGPCPRLGPSRSPPHFWGGGAPPPPPPPRAPPTPPAPGAGAPGLTADDLARPDLRDERVSQAASIVAAIPAVRQALLGFQRGFATTSGEGYGGAVLDGRDIGTVVCPDGDAKIFITASPAVPARPV